MSVVNPKSKKKGTWNGIGDRMYEWEVLEAQRTLSFLQCVQAPGLQEDGTSSSRAEIISKSHAEAQCWSTAYQVTADNRSIVEAAAAAAVQRS